MYSVRKIYVLLQRYLSSVVSKEIILVSISWVYVYIWNQPRHDILYCL